MVIKYIKFFCQGRLDAIDLQKAVDYVLSCMNFDGGFGCRPGSESHSGQVCYYQIINISMLFRGDRDDTVIRALASHQLCGLSLLLILVLAPRVSLQVLQFSSLKN